MNVLSLVKQPLPVQVDKCLGGGADGQVFTIVGDDSRVIKLGIFYERHDKKFLEYYRQIVKVLDHLIKTQPDAYAKVYEHGSLGEDSREAKHWRSGRQKYVMYYYIMDRLYDITEDEEKVFHTILSHEDRGIEKNFSPDKIREMLRGMSRGLDFDAEKVTLFCEKIRSAPISHLDIVGRNIMKDAFGNFKLIDLDRIELEKQDGKE